MDSNSRYDSLLNWSLYVSVFPSSPSSSFCAASTYFAPSGKTISTLDLKIGWSLTNWTKIQSSTSVPIKMLHFFSTHLATTIVDKYSATNVTIHFCFAISCPPPQSSQERNLPCLGNFFHNAHIHFPCFFFFIFFPSVAQWNTLVYYFSFSSLNCPRLTVHKHLMVSLSFLIITTNKAKAIHGKCWGRF